MSGDIYWNSVLALLHFDGSNGSTTLTNEVSGGATPTISGSGALSTTQAKFGSASWKGDSGTYFELAVGSSGSFTGDFTLEWCGHSLADGACTIYSTTGSSYLYNGSFQDYGGSALSLSVSQSGWKHFVICRQGSTMRAYVDGVQTGTATYSGTVDLRTTQWGRYAPNNNLYSTGYIDELRLTAGVCRYPNGTTFTPSSSAFDNFEPATEVILQASGPLQSATAVAASTYATAQASSPLQSAQIVAQLRNAIIQASSPLQSGSAIAVSTSARIAASGVLQSATAVAAHRFASVTASNPLRSATARLYIPPAIRAQASNPLQSGRILAWHDFSAGIPQSATISYVMDVVDSLGGTTRIPISSWQATIQNDAQCYVQCVVPAALEWSDDITAAEEFVIYRKTSFGGVDIEYEMARSPIEYTTTDRGHTNYTMTLSGYPDALTPDDDPPSVYDKTLSGVRTSSFFDAGKRLRCAIDWTLRPSHRAFFGSQEIIVSYINYYVNENDEYMDVGERQ